MSASTPHVGLALHQLVTLAFGTIVGVGWIVMLGQWLSQAGSIGSLLAFLGGAVVIGLVVLCYAELGSMFPVTGGEVIYAFEGLGPAASFLTGWLLALIYIGVAAFEAISMGWLLDQLMPGFDGPMLYSFLGAPVHLGSVIAGITLMACLTWINCAGVRLTAAFQDFMTYALIALTLIFVVAGLWRGTAQNLYPLFVQEPGTSSNWPGIRAVLLTAPFWYAGFSVVSQALGDKSRDSSPTSAGLAMLIAIVAAFCFYALIILATSMAAPRPALLDASLPAAAAFEAAFESPLLSKVVLTAGIFGLLTTWNAVLYAASRLLFALGRARFLPGFLGATDATGRTPVPSILLVGIVAGVATLAGRGAIAPIANVSGAVFALVYGLVSVLVIKLRVDRPGLRRPYRISGGLTVPILAAISSLALFSMAVVELISSSKTVVAPEFVVVVVWIAAGLALSFIFQRGAPTLSVDARRQLLLASLSQR